MKLFRNVYAIVSLIIIIVIVIISVVMSNKPAPEQLSSNSSVKENSSVDLVKLKEVQMGFPENFPFPDDSVITTAAIIDSPFSDAKIYTLEYITNQDTSSIINFYKSALEKESELKVGGIVTSTPGQQSIHGFKANDRGTSLGTYDIGVYVYNISSNSRKVALALTKK